LGKENSRNKKKSPVSEEKCLNGKPSAAARKRELLDMLTALRRHNPLSDAELEEKIQLLDSMKF
jgi:hypothetical protein